MDAFNPYAPPEARIAPQVEPFAQEVGLWRDGPILVMRKGAELPDRCLRCNTPAEGYRLRRTLSWHHPAWFALAISPLIYILVAMLVRKTAKVRVPICPAHRTRRSRAILVGWLGSLIGIGLFVAGLSAPGSPPLNYIGLAMLVASVIFGVAGSQLVIPKRIDKNFAYLRQVSPDFLEPLPDWV